MKKAFLISILFHAVVFAGDFGYNVLGKTKAPLPRIPVRGLSVEISSRNITPSVRRAFKVKPQKRILKKLTTQNRTRRPVQRQRRSFVSQARSAALPFTGREFKSWLLEYYAELLKHIKMSLNKIGVEAGNLTIVVSIYKTGEIKHVDIKDSSYSNTIESNIKLVILGLRLPKFPNRLNRTMLSLKLKIIYK